MYEDWTAKRWETPFSDVQSLVMVSLTDEDCSLAVILEDARGEERTRWRVGFRKVAAYRNILEEYRLSLWARREALGDPKGWSWQVTQSDWLGNFRDDEPLVDLHAKGARHFLIVTEDDVVEVLTPEEPSIEELGPAGDVPAVGKSTVMIRGEDDEEIDRFIAKTRWANMGFLSRLAQVFGLRRRR